MWWMSWWVPFGLFLFTFIVFLIVGSAWQREAMKWKTEYMRLQSIAEKWMREDKPVPIERIRDAWYGPNRRES